jgi:hypothetical protein
MRRLRAFAFASAILAMAGTARPDVPLPTVLEVLGVVTNAAHPVANVLIIALNLNSLDAIKTFSNVDGSFTLPPLPAGVYKIIAVKHGFLPASTMIIPTKKDHHLTLKLDTEKLARARDRNQEIWEIRGSLPPDVLHELDNVLAAPEELPQLAFAPPLAMPRFRGEVSSMSAVTDQTAVATVAQTSLGVESHFGDNWEIGFRGNLRRVGDPTEDGRFGNSALAQSSVMQMEVRSSPTNAYRVASTNSFWRYRPEASIGGDEPQADIHAHNFEWEHGDARVQVRYLAQQNLFASQPGSELVEIAGNTTLIQTTRSDVGVFIRVAQENIRNATNATFRTADLTANASFELVPSFILHYGMSSRIAMDGTSFAPRTAAEWKIAKDTSFIASGQYKVADQTRVITLPAIVVWSDESRVLPRYAYSFGFVSGDEKRDRFSAVGTVTAIDSPMRLIFTDGFEQFWDGLYVDNGDIRRDLRVEYRKQIGNSIAIDMQSSAGVARPTRTSPINIGEKVYMTGDVASTYQPTGTTIAISYRHMRQPEPVGSDEYRSERVNVRVAQALHLPLDLKLLVGIELAHATNSPFLLDSIETDGSSKKYIGGLAVNF